MRGKLWRRIGAVVALIIIIIAGVVQFTVIGQNIWHKTVRYVSAYFYRYTPMAGTEAQFIRQIMTKDPATSRTIMWESLLPEDQALVEYKKADESDFNIQTVDAVSKNFEDGGEKRYIYTAEIKGLEPNTEYVYRVGRDGRDEWHPLSTKLSGDFTALLFPDSQSADYRGWVNLVKTAYTQNPEANFFINIGDLVDNGEDASQWNAWFDAVEPMAENVPFVGVIGNHEYYDKNWQARHPLAYLNFFQFPSNDDPLARNQYYSFDYGDVHFAVLNTQFTEIPEAFRNKVRDAEVAWLKKDLAETKKPWKIVLMHKDALRYPNTKRPDWTPGFTDLGELFMPIFEQNKVDLVLSGHYHMYRRRGHIENFKRSATGPYYIITGVAGDVKYANIWGSHPLDEFISPYPDADNYLVISKKGNALTVSAFLPDGKQFDTVTLKK